jgi:hypothetical protein
MQVLAEEEVKEATALGKVGRNEPCPCGSGLKFKKCHGREVTGKANKVSQESARRS